jgi:hypothetical protein
MESGYERPSRPRLLLAGALVLACALGPLTGRALAASAPTATTKGTAAVGYASAILYGSVNPQGVTSSYGFEYGKTGSYGSKTSLESAGNGTQAITVSQAIQGLEAGTVYHYRLLASSSAGTSYGSEHTFTTARVPLSVTISGTPDPVIFGNPFFVQGTLSGTGAGNREIVLQANPYPYTQGFQTVGNPELTSSSGQFSFPYVGLLQNAQLRVMTVGSPTVTSATVTENVAVRVSLHIRRAHRRGHFAVYGTISPAEPGGLVGFEQVLPADRYALVNGTAVKPYSATESTYSRTVPLKAHTLYRVFVQVKNQANVSTVSASVLSP